MSDEYDEYMASLPDRYAEPERRRYCADGHRAVTAGGIEEAGRLFAERDARRTFGRRGTVRTFRQDSWTRDGTSSMFEAYIGVPVRGERGTVRGHNIRFNVNRCK